MIAAAIQCSVFGKANEIEVRWDVNSKNAYLKLDADPERLELQLCIPSPRTDHRSRRSTSLHRYDSVLCIRGWQDDGERVPCAHCTTNCAKVDRYS